MKKNPKIIKSTTVYKGAWLQFEDLEYQDSSENIRKWEYVKRTQDRGAVVIIGKLLPSNRIVLIRQFRPPIGKYIYEFPAGLIDDGEEPQKTAVREFYEETGYKGVVKEITSPVYNTPGLTNETVNIVFMDIDEEMSINKNPVADQEPTEDIEVLIVDMNKLLEFLGEAERKGNVIDAKLMSFALAKSFFN